MQNSKNNFASVVVKVEAYVVLKVANKATIYKLQSWAIL